MTQGSVGRHIWSFTWPLLIGNVFQQLYTLVDSMIVGRCIGASALGSVGAVSSIINLFFALINGMSCGVNIYIAQHYGGGNDRDVQCAIGNSIYPIAISSGLMSILGIACARPILIGMNVPGENYQDAMTYMVIMCGALLVTGAYNTISSILRALGDSKTPLYFMLLSSVINAGLDVLFVYFFQWGVAGAAYATVIAQIFAAAGSILYAVRHNTIFHLKGEHFRWNNGIIKKTVYLGVPLAMQSATGSLGGVVVQSVVNSFGSTVMSAFAVSNRIIELVSMPYGSLGTACATFTGQNVGAKRYDRVDEMTTKCFRFMLGISAIISIAIVIFRKPIVSLFVTDSQVIYMSGIALLITCISYFFMSGNFVYKATLNGAGDGAFAFVCGILEVLGRAAFILLFKSIPFIGVWGIWVAQVCSSAFSCLLCIGRYRKRKWQRGI